MVCVEASSVTDEFQQSSGARMPDWCLDVLKGQLDSIPYANLHKRAFASLSKDVGRVIRPAQQRFEPTFRHFLEFCMLLTSWLDFRFILTFLTGYLLRHYQTDPWARRWLPVHVIMFICLIRIALLIFGAAAQRFNERTGD